MNGTRPEVAVGAIVVHDRSLLLVRRGRAPGLGRWSVPGGRVEAGERLVDAVIREVREETGITVAVGEMAGVVERMTEGHHFVILDYFATPEPADQIPHAGDDASDARYVPLDEIRALDTVEGLIAFLEQVGSLAPWP